MPTLQPYPYATPLQFGQAAPAAPAAPPSGPGVPKELADIVAALLALNKVPGVQKFDSYLYDERGISAANPTLDIDVVERLGRPATSGFIIADSVTIKVILNGKSQVITLNTGEKLSLSNTDPFRIERILISSASTVAAIRIFLT